MWAFFYACTPMHHAWPPTDNTRVGDKAAYSATPEIVAVSWVRPGQRLFESNCADLGSGFLTLIVTGPDHLEDKATPTCATTATAQSITSSIWRGLNTFFHVLWQPGQVKEASVSLFLCLKHYLSACDSVCVCTPEILCSMGTGGKASTCMGTCVPCVE